MRPSSNQLAFQPAVLVRRVGGRITFWSAAMGERYGFAAEQAIGQVSHELLRTVSQRAFDEIESVLVEQTTWSGGLIHHLADGRPIMSANYWHLARDAESDETLVTEVHADIVAPGTIAGRQLGDVMTTVAHELSQPLTAIGNYISGSRQALEPPWPGGPIAAEGMAQANVQLGRTADTVRLVRDLGQLLRDAHGSIVRLHRSFQKCAATAKRTEAAVQASVHAIQESSRVTAESRALRAPSQPHQRRDAATTSNDLMLRRISVLESIVRHQRKLIHERQGRAPDPESERLMRRLLAEDEARLAVLDNEELWNLP